MLGFTLTAAAQYPPMSAAFLNQVLPASSGGLASFSDDFNRGSLGANWTLEAGVLAIVANELATQETFDFSHKIGIYSATPLAANEYVKV